MGEKKNAKASKPESLLVELLTEELPPKLLRSLSETFASVLFAELTKSGFADPAQKADVFATPRRLAVRLPKVAERSPDTAKEIAGPPVGAPRQAIDGFARKFGFAASALGRRATPKGDVYVAHLKTAGQPLAEVLAGKVEAALKSLSVPKLMRWSEGEAQFVRPVHSLVMMHGSRVLPGIVLGVKSGNRTRGHRFMGKSEIVLKGADEYEARLRDEGKVVADFAARRDDIRKQLQAAANKLKAQLGEHENLLDEVTALVEHPSVYVGEFDAAFLEVPHECLTLAMRQHQRYFPLFDDAGRLLPKFLIVSNMKPADPRHVIHGNERVVRPRLEDARFFYNQDRKLRLEARVPELAKVVYHHKLGTQRDRVDRLKLLSGEVAQRLDADRALAERAAELCKADLLTGMVGEFPELQGIMGRYYALHDGEPREVADAIEAHYRPRFSGDKLPEGAIACSVALADKLDMLIGLFAAGESPTGDRDPFALRRHALGVVRILLELKLPLDVMELLRTTRDIALSVAVKRALTDGEMKWLAERAVSDVLEFLLDRARGYLREEGFAPDEIEAVLAKNPGRLDVVPNRLEAVREFKKLPEATNLAAANKRIRNILRKSDAAAGNLDEALLREPAEHELFRSMRETEPAVRKFIAAGDYVSSLTATATLQITVDKFFDKVLVNVDDAALRANRHALLKQLESLMNEVADISKLAAA